jgi:hypothetical protein
MEGFVLAPRARLRSEHAFGECGRGGFLRVVNQNRSRRKLFILAKLAGAAGVVRRNAGGVRFGPDGPAPASLRATPAMAAEISSHAWSVVQILAAD